MDEGVLISALMDGQKLMEIPGHEKEKGKKLQTITKCLMPTATDFEPFENVLVEPGDASQLCGKLFRRLINSTFPK